MKRYDRLYEQKIPRANLGIYKKERIAYRFKDVHMDLNVIQLLWQVSGGGTEMAEIWATISRMEKVNRESWDREFVLQGELLEQLAIEAQQKDHIVSAREAFFRASSYYGTAKKREKQVECFRAAAQMSDTPIEPVAVPFEGKHLPGYFIKAANDNQKRKTLIFIGGGDTILEELYFLLGPAAVKRGYNIFAVEVPGQGGPGLESLEQKLLIFSSSSQTVIPPSPDNALKRISFSL